MNEATIKAELAKACQAIEARCIAGELLDMEASKLMQMERKIADRKMADLRKQIDNERTWTIKWETMSGRIRESKVKAQTNAEAIVELCRLEKVGNILGVSDCYRVQWA